MNDALTSPFTFSTLHASPILAHGVWFEDAYSSILHFPAILNGEKGIFKWHPEEPLITVYESAEEKIIPLNLVN